MRSPCSRTLRLHHLILRQFVTLCACALALLPTTLAAQSERGGPVPDVVMLKRIAEAVDGHRTGGLVYVVASLAGDHPVAGVFGDRKEADELLQKLGKGFSRFGPFQAPLDAEPGYMVGCVHLKYSSMMHPESNMCVPPPNVARFDEVIGVSLLLTRTNGRQDTLPMPRGTDLIVLTLNAFDKFAVPYYQRTLGLEGATALRAGFAAVYQSGKVPRRRGDQR
jgi:hypothetical protein